MKSARVGTASAALGLVAAAAVLWAGCASGPLGARPEAQDPSYDDGGDASKVVPVTFDLSDDDLSICTVLVEFWTDTNGEWRPATLVPGAGYSVTGAGTATGFHPGVIPSQYTVLWDSWTDEVGKVLGGEAVDVRVTPSDIDGTGTSGVSALPFTVDNWLARMEIQAPGVVDFFHGYRNAANPTNGAFTIVNTGPVALDWEITDISYPGGETPWIVAPLAGSTSGTAAASGGTSVVTVSVNPDTADLAPGGVYTAIITVDDTNVPKAYDSPQEVSVTITVSSPVMRVEPASVAFQEGVFDFSSPAVTESFSIYNDGPAYTELHWTVDDTVGGWPSWLSIVGLNNGSVDGGAAPATVELAADHAPGAPSTPLPVATYPYTVTVDDSAGAGVPSRDVGVTFPIRPQRPSIFIHDGGGTAFPGDVIDISCVETLTGSGSFSIRNDGEPATVLDWTLSEGADWLTCSMLNGSLAATVSDSVTADVDAAALTADLLSPWDYEAVITVSGSDLSTGEPAQGPDNGERTLTVHLNVLQPGQIDLSLPSVSFPDATWNTSYPTASPQPVTLTNSGEVALNWTGAWVGAVNWITVTGTQSGTVAIGGIDSDVLTFTVNASASTLGIGDKTATYRYTNTDTGQTRDLTLSLHVNYRDLIVLSMTHSPSSPQPGNTVTFTVTVRNQGDADAGAFTLGFWSHRLSAPLISTVPDQTWTFAGLAAGASAPHAFTITAPAVGTRSAWAFVDRGAGVTPGDVLEYYEANNAGPSGGHSWTVGLPPAGDSFEDDDNFAQATTISNGVAQPHSIHDSSDVDYVKFLVSGPTTITAWTNGPDPNDDSVIYLYDPSYVEIAWDDDGGFPDWWSRIVLSVTTPGWYYVRVEPYSSPIASYTITVTW